MKNSSSTDPSSPTNSPTGKPPSGQQTSQQTQRELIEQAISATVMEIIQLRRTLWLVLNQSGPMEVDEKQTHPLWRMNATRLEDGRVRLEAAQLPDPTVEQISLLAAKLEGTMTPLEEAIADGDLKDYPPAFLQMRLRHNVVQANTGYWVDATLHSISETPPSDKN